MTPRFIYTTAIWGVLPALLVFWVRIKPTPILRNLLTWGITCVASFALLLRLGGKLELRSNWQLYVEEFGCAMHLAGQRGCIRAVDGSEPDLSLFEQKYRRSGHELWSYTVSIMP